MKYLWTRQHRNYLLLVRIHLRGKQKITLPISLWALEESLRALHDVVGLGQSLLRYGSKRLSDKSKHKWIAYVAALPTQAPLDLGLEILSDLRKQDRFRLAEIEEYKYQIQVDLF